MKLYLVIDKNPCFDCSNPEILGIYNSIELAIVKMNAEANREGTYRRATDIGILSLPVNANFDEATDIEFEA